MCIRDSTERVTKRILTEEEMSALSDRLMQVTKGMTITVRYFKEDTAHPEIPAVGNYVTLTGKADRIDPVFRTLQAVSYTHLRPWEWESSFQTGPGDGRWRPPSRGRSLLYARNTS